MWRDDELSAVGLGNKTGQAMGHIAMSGDSGAIEGLAGLKSAGRYFCISTIPTRRSSPTRPERKIIERAGWQIPADGTEITL